MQGIGAFDDVLLVGGSCRVPAVAAMLRERFGFEPKMHDPDQAVAKGAALFALIESVKVELPAEAEDGARPEVSEAKVQAVADKLGITAKKVRELAGKRVATVVPRAFGVKVLNKKDDPEHPTFSINHILEANRPLPASPDAKQFYYRIPGSGRDPDRDLGAGGSGQLPAISPTTTRSVREGSPACRRCGRALPST